MFALCLFLLLAQSPSFDAALRAGLEALQHNDLASARVALESAARMQPDQPQVWLALAQTYWKLQESNLAGSAAEKAERLSLRHPVVFKALSLFYSESGNYEKAAECAAAYASKALDDPGAYGRAIQLYLQARKPKPAIDLARTALALENRADVRYLLGKAYEMDGQPVESVREMRAAIKLNPYEESYYFELARDLLKHNGSQEAIQVLEDGKKDFARSAQIELTLGVAYYSMRRFSDAVDAFLRVIRIDPGVEQPYVFLGRMLDQTASKLPDVTAAFAALAKANPKNYTADFLYGKALAFGGQRDQAEALLRKSVAENDEFWESHFELGGVLEAVRDFAGAAREFRRAAELNPKNPGVHYRLARVYDRLGKADEAKAEHALHAKLTQEENAFIRRQAGGMERLEGDAR
jgi:tetratricopeptide (TPR) repeat protein